MRELSVFEAARDRPDGRCLMTDDQVLTFADAAEQVAGAIGRLEQLGVQPGDRVAIRPGLDLDSILWLYALFELGCPAILLHPGLTVDEQKPVLAASRPVHLIDESVPSRASRGRLRQGSVPESRCLAILQTSGSSGASRGAILSRRAFVASHEAHAANLPWQDHDRWLLNLPLAHVGGLSIVTRCLIARRTVVLGPPRFDAAAVIDAAAVHQVTLLSLVPTMLRRLLSAETPRWEPEASLRAVLVGGAAFTAPLRASAVERGVPVLATYGATEVCSQVATQRPDQTGTPGCGPPLRGIKLRIEGGEIQVRGPTLMDGYLDDDDPAGGAHSPFTTDRWLRTRDAGAFLSDGQLDVHGRLDSVIVTGGENVAPIEVESVLESLPGVLQACVFSVPSEEWGCEVVAALVVDPMRFDRDALGPALDARLAPHKRPKRLALTDALPLNRTGKVDRDRVSKTVAADLRPIRAT